jgi:hypothetical protein
VVERKPEELSVVGSIPTLGTILRFLLNLLIIFFGRYVVGYLRLEGFLNVSNCIVCVIEKESTMKSMFGLLLLLSFKVFAMEDRQQCNCSGAQACAQPKNSEHKKGKKNSPIVRIALLHEAAKNGMKEEPSRLNWHSDPVLRAPTPPNRRNTSPIQVTTASESVRGRNNSKE